MATGRKTGGRQKGSRNKRTLQIEAAGQEAVAAVTEALGTDAFEGDAHAMLVAVYKNKNMPIELRLDAAKSAVRYEKPALSSVDNTIEDKRHHVARLPQPTASTEEWLHLYGNLKDQHDKPN